MVALLQMNERHLRWYSASLSREFDMLAFGNGGGLPLIIFPTSFGSYYQNKDFGLVGSVNAFVDAGRVTVYCPDAIDLESFYNKSIHPADRMRTHNAYENVIVHEVIRSCAAGVRLPSSRSLRSQSRRLSRGQHCLSSSRRRQSPYQLERVVRY